MSPYDSNIKARWDYENSIAFAKENAEHKKALEIARELFKERSSHEFIAKVTKLPLEEIKKL